MDYSYFQPREMHLPLRWLGRNIKLNIEVGEFPKMRVSIDVLAQPPKPEWASLLAPFVNYARKGIDYFLIYMHSKILADGPKVIKPTLRQCQALAEMNIDIGVEQFAQPFNNLIVILPEEYRKELEDRFNCPAPSWAISYWESDRNLLLVMSHYPHDGSDIVVAVPSRDRTIEERIRLRDLNKHFKKGDGPLDYGPEYDMAEMSQRIALNMGMILMEGPVKLAALDPKATAKAKEMAGSKNPERREIGTRHLAGQIYEILPDQSITFYEEKFISMPTEGDPVEGSRHSSPKKPHWRRGHWHRYWTGSGDLKKCIRKLVKPVFVSRDRFLGDPADVAVQYKTRDSRTGVHHA